MILPLFPHNNLISIFFFCNPLCIDLLGLFYSCFLLFWGAFSGIRFQLHFHFSNFFHHLGILFPIDVHVYDLDSNILLATMHNCSAPHRSYFILYISFEYRVFLEILICLKIRLKDSSTITKLSDQIYKMIIWHNFLILLPVTTVPYFMHKVCRNLTTSIGRVFIDSIEDAVKCHLTLFLQKGD